MSVSTPFADALPQEVQLPYLAPDFSQIQQVAQRANSIFEQGISQVKNDYSSVLNAPVTGQAAEERKQQYINNFQQGLKKITPRDLRMPQDVVQAENLLQPFWTDRALIKNMYGTKTGNQNIQKIQQGLLSKDDKERDMYSPIQIQDQQDMLQELGEAGMDEQKIDRVQPRTIAPFVNLPKMLNERAKDQKMEIRYTTGTNSPYLVSTVNGKQSIPNYKTWATAQLGTDTEGMFQTIGRVAAKHARNSVLRELPGLPDELVNQGIAAKTYDQMDKMYTDRSANYKVDIASIDRQLKEIEDRSPVNQKGQKQPTPADMDVWNQLRSMKQDYGDFLKDNDYKYTTFKTNKQSTLQSIANDPSSYFADLEKSRQIDNWATGMAANTQVDVKENSGYVAMMQEARLRNELAETIQRDRNTAAYQQGELANKRADIVKDYIINGYKQDPHTGEWVVNPQAPGSKSGTANTVDPTSGTIYADNTDQSHQINSFDAYMSDLINNGAKIVNENLWGVQGLAGRVLVNAPVNIDGKVDKINISDIDLGSQAIQKKFANPNYAYTPGETLALVKLGNSIGAKNWADPESMRQALDAKVGQIEKNKDGTPNMTSLMNANDLQNSDNNLAKIIADRQQAENTVKHLILSRPDKYKQLTVNGQLATPSNMAPDFPSVQLADDHGNPVPELNPRTFADLHTKGGYQMLGQDRIRVGNNVYQITGINGVPNSTWGLPAGVQLERTLKQNIEKKYGSAADFPKKYQEAQNEVVKALPEVAANSGSRGYLQSFNRKTPAQKATLDALSNSLSQPSGGMYVYDNDGKKLEPKDITDYHAIMKDGSENISNIDVKPYGGTGGGPSAVITFGAKEGADSKTLDFIKGHPTIKVDIDPATDDGLIKSIIATKGNVIFGDMMRTKKPYTSNTVQKAHGFDCDIVATGEPDRTGHYTSFAISGTYGYLNPETGKMETRDIRNANTGVLTGSFKKTTPQEIINMRDKEFADIMTKNIANYQYYIQHVNPNTPTFDQLEAQYHK